MNYTLCYFNHLSSHHQLKLALILLNYLNLKNTFHFIKRIFLQFASNIQATKRVNLVHVVELTLFLSHNGRPIFMLINERW